MNRPRYADPALDSASVRTAVWKLAQEIMQEDRSGTMTIAGLSQALIRSATHVLEMTESELVRLLKNHIPH